MIIQVLMDGSVVDTFSVTMPSNSRNLFSRVIRSNSKNFATPSAGAHTFTVQAQLEPGDGGAGSGTVPSGSGMIIAMPVKAV